MAHSMMTRYVDLGMGLGGSMDEGLSNLDRYGKGLYAHSPAAARRDRSTTSWDWGQQGRPPASTSSSSSSAAASRAPGADTLDARLGDGGLAGGEEGGGSLRSSVAGDDAFDAIYARHQALVHPGGNEFVL